MPPFAVRSALQRWKLSTWNSPFLNVSSSLVSPTIIMSTRFNSSLIDWNLFLKLLIFRYAHWNLFGCLILTSLSSSNMFGSTSSFLTSDMLFTSIDPHSEPTDVPSSGLREKKKKKNESVKFGDLHSTRSKSSRYFWTSSYTLIQLTSYILNVSRDHRSRIG